MAKLIKNGKVVDDNWQVLPADATEVPAGPVIVPLALWQSAAGELADRGDLGVWLAPDEDPAELADALPSLAVVAIEFPKFADGRGYSSAALLRSRYGYRGELRAIGEVLRDQFFYLTRCGFDALQPAEGRYTDEQLVASLASLGDFSEPYQGAIDRPEPVWRRHQRQQVAA
ncbi:MAG: DUF934 domain-containing protein [Rhodocyclaceae bacterium]|nr:DUF934 domain-containing protein [Rhodocyclaceae bacterium]